jgi:hypothetical protein
MVGGSYLRAMLGSLSVLFPLAGLVLGVLAATGTGLEALPPSTALLGAILVLSALDGIAGFAAGIGYFTVLLVTGSINSLNSVLVVAGSVVAMTGVSQMAEMVRPLTRPPGRGWEGRWNRTADAVVGALFVAKLYGIELPFSSIALVAASSVVLNFSTPGIPSGGMLLQVPLYTSIGLPVEGIGIMIALDTLPDMFKTLLNVTADMLVAVMTVPAGELAAGVE